MKSVPLTVYPRSASKRSGAKKLRGTGRVPAVIYGRICQPQNLELNAKELEDLLHVSASSNLLLDLAVAGDSKSPRLALLQEIQHHPLNGNVLHVDFHEVAPDEKVTVAVPVETTGEPLGVKTGGGTLEHVRFSLKIRALPKDLPEQLVVDVSHLDIGMAIHVGDIQPPPGVELLGNKKIVVLAVAAPVSEAQEAAAEAAATEGAIAEPEVLKEKKEEGAAEGEKAGAPEKAGEKKPAEKKPAEKAPEKKPEKKK